MSSNLPSPPSPLSRYRPAVLFLTGLAAAYGIYLIRNQFFTPSHTGNKQNSLRRSNAIHSSHRRTRNGDSHADGTSAEAAQARHGSGQDELAELHQPLEGLECGTYSFTDPSGRDHDIPLSIATLPSVEDFESVFGLSHSQAELHRNLIELQFLAAFSQTRLPRSFLVEPFEVGERLRQYLISRGISEVNVDANIRRSALRVAARRQGDQRGGGRSSIPRQDEAETVMEAESEYATRMERSVSVRGGQSLLQLLYHIAEDQARREGYIHRGVTCNSCGTVPIRGIRYRCSNCADFDLCETCEAMQVHPKTHLFYKVRIPAPFLANPKQAQPVWYPGKPGNLSHSLPQALIKRLSRETSYENSELNAMWDQFKCLAASEWRHDPNGLRLAIDRRTFDRCFSPIHTPRLRPPQLIYDRIFAFYDTNGDGYIGFEEFLKGLACLNNKNRDERMKRVYQGYDLDGDGYVDRKDFLRMFRSFYALTKELTEEMILGLEEEGVEAGNVRDVILGSQPLSSIFTINVPEGERHRRRQGKNRTAQGDWEIVDDEGPVMESQDDTVERSTIIGDATVRNLNRISVGTAYRTRLFSPSIHVRDEEFEQLLNRMAEREDIQLPSAPRSETQGNNVNEARRENDENNPDGPHSSSALHPDRENEDEDDEDEDDWPPHWVITRDIETVLGDGIPAEDIFSPVHRRQIEAVARMRQAIERNQRVDIIRRQGVEERWRRRQFYVDQEEGVTPLEDYEDSIDYSWPTGNLRDSAEEDQSAGSANGNPPSPRSRSSSKVRFQDDPTAYYETRSNHSTSAKSIPVGERWGGYEIPEPEKDMCREILYQVTQQGLNEMLDPLFSAKENMAMQVLATREQRSKWRHVWAPREGQESASQLGQNDGQAADEAGILDHRNTAGQQSSPAGHAESDQHVVAETHNPSDTAPATQLEPDDISASAVTYPCTCHSSQGEQPPPTQQYDPTLPQHRPDTAEPAPLTTGPETEPAAPASQTQQGQASPSNYSTSKLPSSPPTTPSPPTTVELSRLKALDEFEDEIRARGGPGRLSYAEFCEFMNGEQGKSLAFFDFLFYVLPM